MGIVKRITEVSSLIAESRYAEAEEQSVKLLKDHPRDVSVLCIAALLEQRNDNFSRARELARIAYSIEPNNHSVLHAFAEILHQQKRYDSALEKINKALEIQSDKINYLCLQARCLMSLERYAEAKNVFTYCLQFEPDSYWLLNGLASASLKLDDLDEGLEAVNKAIEIQPNGANLYNTRGAIKREQGEEKAAMQDFERALELLPTEAGFYSNVALSLMYLNHYISAMRHFRVALQLDPNNVIAASNLAYCLLGLGFLKEGWVAYQYRKPKQYMVDRVLDNWDGSTVLGDQLLVRPEQGIGDQMRFVSCVDELATEMGAITVQCDPRLIPIFERSFSPKISWMPGGVDSNNLIAGKEQLKYEIFMGDLPARYRNHINDFPEIDGYLSANPDKVDYWNNYLNQLNGDIKVGICWRSGVMKGKRKTNFPNISQWGPLFAIPNVTFVNLFYDECEEELKYVQETYGVTIHDPANINLKTDLDDVAALITALDLTISVSSSVLDLAGALKGALAWDLTFRDKDDSHYLYCGERYNPWCPSMKPIFAKGFDECLSLAGIELREIVSMSDPKAYLQSCAAVYYAHYEDLLFIQEAS